MRLQDKMAIVTGAGSFAALWGTDRPHVNLDGPMSGDVIPQIVPSAALQQAMLVDNPADCFGFTRDL